MVLMKKKSIIKQQIISAISNRYLESTQGFEDLVKNLSAKINDLKVTDSKAKEEIKKMKNDLENQMKFFSTQELFEKEFKSLSEKCESKLKDTKINNILISDFNFGIKMSNCNLEWINGSNRITTSPQGSSYWTIKSKEVVSGPFSAKIKVININGSLVNSHWNFTCGIIRANSTNEPTYYNDGIIFQSNGYIADKFSSSGSHKQLFFTPWATGDSILIKRDDQNNVFFGINSDSSFQLAFPLINGDFRIVMGFSTAVNGDIFELEELVKTA